MGTENFGRDVLSRFLYGTRVSMFVSSGCGGARRWWSARCSGCCAGLRRARVWDTLIMRGMDVVLAFPLLVLVPVLSGVLGTRDAARSGRSRIGQHHRRGRAGDRRCH